MTDTLVNYILESTLCLLLFTAAYRLLMSNLTHFSWMRFYLVCSLTLSLLLPLIIIPIHWDSNIFPSEPLSIALQLPTELPGAFVNNLSQINLADAPSKFTTEMMVLYFILFTYLSGVAFKLCLFLRNLNKILGFIKKNHKVKEVNYWIVNLENETPAFSFFNYIFINSSYKGLSAHELQLIKNHEIAHVKQYHTLDLMLFEIASIVFWFNPLMGYLRKSIRDIHEYIVDERIAGQGESKKAYASLLLNLASASKAYDLTTSFTGEHTKRRILMIAKQRTSAKYKFAFIVLIPITSILLLSFSYFENSKSLGPRNSEGKPPWVIHLELQKYCGVYLPLNPGPVAMEIQLKNNALVTYLVLVESEKRKYNPEIPWTQNPASWTKELQYVSGNKFADSSLYKNANIIEFVLNNKNEVTGCLFTQREGLGFVTHEFKKKN
jgi:hypothetical protein